MDTELLKTFLEVSRTRHFGQAAEALYLTQSAISSRIRQLETQLGVNLFTRHRNNIQLTDAGERLLPYAETLISTWLLAKKEVQNSFQHRELSIGATPLLWESLLTDWLQEIYHQFPAIQLEARIGQRQTHVRQLHERTLDLLIATEYPKMDELSARKIGEFVLQLFTSDHQSVKELPFIRLDWGADFMAQENEWIGEEKQPVLTTTSVMLAGKVIKSTGGKAFFPVHMKEKLPHITPCEHPRLIRPVYAVWLHNSDRGQEITSLLSIPLNDAQT